MKNIIIFLAENFHFFGGKFFSIIELACFRNVNQAVHPQDDLNLRWTHKSEGTFSDVAFPSFMQFVFIIKSLRTVTHMASA